MGLLDKYPINVAALSKGQLLTIDELKQITGKKTGTDEWSFAMLALREFIQDHTDFTVKVTVEGLRILTDSEASIHNHRRFNSHIGGALRRYHRNTLVDTDNLHPEEADQHKRNLVNESRYISAITQTGRRIAVEAHQAKLPPTK